MQYIFVYIKHKLKSPSAASSLSTTSVQVQQISRPPTPIFYDYVGLNFALWCFFTASTFTSMNAVKVVVTSLQMSESRHNCVRVQTKD